MPPYPVPPPPVPAAAPVLPLVDPPDIYSNLAIPLPHPMDTEVDYDGSGDNVPAEPAGHSDDQTFLTAAGPAEQTINATVETLVGRVHAVYSAVLTPAQWAALPPTTRGDMIMKAPLTVQTIHAMDAEARLLQQRLKDDAFRETIVAATSRRDKSRAKMTSLKATQKKLRQQLAAADRNLAQALSSTESSDRAFEAAERSAPSLAASRRRPGQQGCCPRRGPSPSFTDRELSSPSPRSPRDVLRPAYTCRPADSSFMGVRLDDLTSPQHLDLGATSTADIRLAAQALLDTFESFPGATLCLVFRHIDTAPASPERTQRPTPWSTSSGRSTPSQGASQRGRTAPPSSRPPPLLHGADTTAPSSPATVTEAVADNVAQPISAAAPPTRNGRGRRRSGVPALRTPDVAQEGDRVFCDVRRLT